MSSGKVYTRAPIFLAIETAYRAFSILASFVFSERNRSYLIDDGLIASIKSHITMEFEIDESLKPVINVCLPAFLSYYKN